MSVQRKILVGMAGLLLGISAWRPLPASELKPAARMAIIRDLTAEYATLKAPLPRGKKGLLLHSSGKVDEESLKHEITQYGTAIAPHVLVQITGLEFHNKEIILEINGGGTRKSKWYEHVEVGVGMGTHPIGQGDTRTPTGSSISLQFPKNLKDLTVDDLKYYLSPVLDFNPTTPLQAITRPVPPEFKEAIEAKKAVAGMDREMVTAAMGPPQRKVREEKDGIEQEDWIYGTPPLKVIFVTFEGDEVVDVKEYVGGVGGSVQPPPEEPPR